MPDEVLRFDLGLPMRQASMPVPQRSSGHGKPGLLSPEWTSEELEESLITVRVTKRALNMRA